jgi:tripartite-type tricarboxylate transporter receptor subunit TctC
MQSCKAGAVLAQMWGAIADAIRAAIGSTRVRPMLALAAMLCAGAVHAADFPVRPIRLVVPFAAGGATDVVARTLATGLSKSMGQQVVVDNKPGAGGIVAGNIVANAPPDGYTLLMGSIGMLAIAPNLRTDLPFSFDKNFVAVAQVSATPNVIVAHPSLAVKNVRELLALAKANPDKISFGSSGPATSTHLSGELFQAMGGIRLVHVPYRGGALALTDLLAGQIPLMFDTMSSVPSIRNGKLKALAVTSEQRSALLPEVPTVAESGLPGYKTSSWNGIIAPTGTPPDVVARLNTEINRVLQSPDIQRTLATDGSEARGGTAAEFNQFIRDEASRWGQLIRDANIKVSE